jgi:hypothetical protein
MIICLFIYFFLNYFTYSFTLPVWVCAVSYALQLICIVIAQILWERQKEEVRELRREVRKEKTRPGGEKGK